MRMGRSGDRPGRVRWIPVIAVAAATLLTAGCGAVGTIGDSGAMSSEFRSEAPLTAAPAPALAQPGGGADSSEAAQEQGAEVITGSLNLQSDDPIATASRIVEIVDDADGRVDQRSDSPDPGGTAPTSSLTVRIPADDFDEIIEDLSALGTVGQLTVDRTNVTAEVADIDARVAALRTSIDRLTRLIAETTNTAELIEAEAGLTERQQDLDAMLARQRALADQVDLATVHLWISTEAVDVPGDGFVDWLREGWRALLASLGGLIIFVGAAIPWVVLLGIVALLVWLLLGIGRAGRRRRAARRERKAQRKAERQARKQRETTNPSAASEVPSASTTAAAAGVGGAAGAAAVAATLDKHAPASESSEPQTTESDLPAVPVPASTSEPSPASAPSPAPVLDPIGDETEVAETEQPVPATGRDHGTSVGQKHDPAAGTDYDTPPGNEYDTPAGPAYDTPAGSAHDTPAGPEYDAVAAQGYPEQAPLDDSEGAASPPEAAFEDEDEEFVEIGEAGSSARPVPPPDGPDHH